jgi:hypothetical protein
MYLLVSVEFGTTWPTRESVEFGHAGNQSSRTSTYHAGYRRYPVYSSSNDTIPWLQLFYKNNDNNDDRTGQDRTGDHVINGLQACFQTKSQQQEILPSAINIGNIHGPQY